MHRLLYISASSPVPSKLGPARRNFHVLEQLSREFDVTLLTTGTQEQEALFRTMLGRRIRDAIFVGSGQLARNTFVRKVWRTATNRCDFLPALSTELRDACDGLMHSRSFDAVVLSHVLLRSMPIPRGMVVIGDTHNADFDVLRRMGASSGGSLSRRLYALAQWRATRAEEQRCARAVDLLLATSDRDAQLFTHELGVAHTVVVPNGIDLSEFVRSVAPADRSTILFSGLMSYYPNQQGIRWFIERVMPLVLRDRPETKLVVAGAAPPRWLRGLASESIHVTGSVQDMRPYLACASVVLAPLWHGGGTRVKILEAMATCRPVVSTTIGCEGLGSVHGESILVADTPVDFSASVVRLLRDSRLAHSIGEGGIRHVTTHFDWEMIGAQLRAHVCTTLQRAEFAARATMAIVA